MNGAANWRHETVQMYRNSCHIWKGDVCARLPNLSQRHTWRFYTPIAANLIASDFRWRLMRTHLAIFFVDRGDVAVLKTSDKIAQPDGLALLAIRSNKRRKSRERANLANAGEFNRRYLTCQISGILYADRGDRRIKSPSVSLALGNDDGGGNENATKQ